MILEKVGSSTVNWRELLGVRQELGEGGERRLIIKKLSGSELKETKFSKLCSKSIKCLVVQLVPDSRVT